MADLSGSIEDNIAKKLKLNELEKIEQVKAILTYFQAIVEGGTKTSPPELKGLLNLMYEKLKDDSSASITKYILTHDNAIQLFFKTNMQRFDQFEFKPYFLKLKGEKPAEAFKVPVNDRRNFERIKPIDMKPYIEILEANPLTVQMNKERAVKTDVEHYEAERKNEIKKIEKQLGELKQKIKTNINKGVFSKDKFKETLQFVEENCIPALQIKYNTEAVNALLEVFLEEKVSDFNKIFESLKMPLKQREKFYQLLIKKVPV